MFIFFKDKKNHKLENKKDVKNENSTTNNKQNDMIYKNITKKQSQNKTPNKIDKSPKLVLEECKPLEKIELKKSLQDNFNLSSEGLITIKNKTPKLGPSQTSKALKLCGLKNKKNLKPIKVDCIRKNLNVKKSNSLSELLFSHPRFKRLFERILKDNLKICTDGQKHETNSSKLVALHQPQQKYEKGFVIQLKNRLIRISYELVHYIFNNIVSANFQLNDSPVIGKFRSIRFTNILNNIFKLVLLLQRKDTTICLMNINKSQKSKLYGLNFYQLIQFFSQSIFV